MLISALQHKSNSISNFFEKNLIFGFHAVASTREDLSVDVSITYVGLVLTKPGRFLGVRKLGVRTEFNLVDFQLLKKKFTFLGFHGVVLVKTFPLMYQLLM